MSANTRVKDDKGLFGLDKQRKADRSLIPASARFEWMDRGSLVSSERSRHRGRRGAWEASDIQAGRHPTAEQARTTFVGIENNKKVWYIAIQSTNIAPNQQNIAANKEAIA